MDEDYFWSQLEADAGPINDHLKQILKIQNLCSIALGDLSDLAIQSIEQDMRDMSDFLKQEEEQGGTPLFEIYGKRFGQEPEQFKFLAGEALLLLNLAGIIKTKGFAKFHRQVKIVNVNQVIRTPEVEELEKSAIEKIKLFYVTNDFGNFINSQILDNLGTMSIKIMTREDGKVLAEVFCPICFNSGKAQSVKLTLSDANTWKIYGFTRHIELVHINSADSKVKKTQKRPAKSPVSKSAKTVCPESSTSSAHNDPLEMSFFAIKTELNEC